MSAGISDRRLLARLLAGNSCGIFRGLELFIETLQLEILLERT
jgi:hypothetical protein